MLPGTHNIHPENLKFSFERDTPAHIITTHTKTNHTKGKFIPSNSYRKPFILNGI